jgi:predicted enzyme related to lactoylglutathione lyase
LAHLAAFDYDANAAIGGNPTPEFSGLIANLAANGAVALLDTLAYTFARIGAVVKLKVEDYFQTGKPSMIRFSEKGGKGGGDPSLQKLPKNLAFFFAISGLKDSQRSKLVGSMTTSRMVIPRGRVSMNITTLATSLASSRLPDSLASFNFSSGQSARSARRRYSRRGKVW